MRSCDRAHLIQNLSVLFLNSLDQLSDQDDGRALRWLPTSLPKSVHIVVSTLPNTGGCLAVLKTKLKPESNADFYLEVILLSLIPSLELCI